MRADSSNATAEPSTAIFQWALKMGPGIDAGAALPLKHFLIVAVLNRSPKDQTN